MSLEASAILLKSLGATGLVSPAAEALAKKNPAIQASAKQLAEAGKKMHPTLNQVCRALLRFLLGGEGMGGYPRFWCLLRKRPWTMRPEGIEHPGAGTGAHAKFGAVFA